MRGIEGDTSCLILNKIMIASTLPLKPSCNPMLLLILIYPQFLLKMWKSRFKFPQILFCIFATNSVAEIYSKFPRETLVKCPETFNSKSMRRYEEYRIHIEYDGEGVIVLCWKRREQSHYQSSACAFGWAKLGFMQKFKFIDP